MGFVYWGIGLIILGLLIGLLGGPFGGTISNIGWLLLIVGVVLAVLDFLTGRRVRAYP
ncbi:MAG TPA: DUF1328 domain-containing protein [Candidatus Thermoplasmatota archaeon]|nr:DUF1328 domain-containing protein [Candidatus Thermoplasmatota archaeon]